ncbi:hypothetical protein BB560_006490, partial [Smittium megazygosporum]
MIKRPAPILEKNLFRKRDAQINLSTFALLFSEIIQLSEIGYRVGIRIFELTMQRERTIHRENRVLNILLYINTTIWKFLFGKQADSLEKSTENADEYMITDNDPLLSKFISIPKEMVSFNPYAFIAGIIEAILEACQC